MKKIKESIYKGFKLCSSINTTFLRLQNQRNGQTISDHLPVKEDVEVGGKWMWLLKSNMSDTCDDGNVLYLDCIIANTLAVLLHCNFVGLDYWRQLSTGYTKSFYVISYTSRESTIVLNF